MLFADNSWSAQVADTSLPGSSEKSTAWPNLVNNQYSTLESEFEITTDENDIRKLYFFSIFVYNFLFR